MHARLLILLAILAIIACNEKDDPNPVNELTGEIISPPDGAVYTDEDSVVQVIVNVQATINLHEVEVLLQTAEVIPTTVYERTDQGNGTEPYLLFHDILLAQFVVGEYILTVEACGDQECNIHFERSVMFSVE